MRAQDDSFRCAVSMPVTVTVTISSTIQDSIKLNDADIRGGGRGRDLTEDGD